MKTKMVFIALAILWSSVQVINAQEKEKKVYSFCVTTSGVGGTDVYISQVVTGYKYKEGFMDASQAELDIQWMKKLKLEGITLSYPTYLNKLWSEDYDKVSEYRDEAIIMYKDKKRNIHYIDDFWFNQQKK